MQAGGFCGKKTGLSANPKAFINSSNYLALMNLETSKCQISVMSANGVFTECWNCKSSECNVVLYVNLVNCEFRTAYILIAIVYKCVLLV